ncbi:STRP2 protein, partial [Polypterus senegalus]
MEALIGALERLNEESEYLGLRVSWIKTKIQAFNDLLGTTISSVFAECDTEMEALYWSRHNIFLLYNMGTFTALLELLSMEIENNQACSSALRKPAISLADSTELRVMLSIMYLIVETIRLECEEDTEDWKSARETFKTDLGNLVLLHPTLALQWWRLARFIAHPEVIQVLGHLVPIALLGESDDSSSRVLESLQHPLAATPAPTQVVEDSMSHGAMREIGERTSARETATKRPGGGIELSMVAPPEHM